MPYLDIEIADADLTFNTDGLGICNNYMERYMDAGEERQYYCGDTIVGLASTLYEDGEIYVAVKFYKTVIDSSGKNITLAMESDGELSAEDESRIAAECEAGMLDYFLTTVPEYAHIVLQYEPEQLSVTGCYPIDTSANNPAATSGQP